MANIADIPNGQSLKTVRGKLNSMISVINNIDQMDENLMFLEILKNGLGGTLVRDTTNLSQIVSFKKGQVVYFADIAKDDVFYIKNDVDIPANENIEDAWNNDKTNIEKMPAFDASSDPSKARWKALAKELLQLILT